MTTATAKRPVGRPGPAGAREWPRVTIRVAPDSLAALAGLAESRGVSVTAYVADVVAGHVRAASRTSVKPR